MKKILFLLLACGFVLRAAGQVSFAPATNYAVGAQPQGVIAVDVNGDGNLDLVTANSGNNTLTILTNNGAGAFALASSPVVGSSPLWVVGADVNGDGYVDLITANGGDNTLTVLTNNGHGGFQVAASPVVGSADYWCAAADVNGDGKIDLIGANSSDGTLSILTNNGTGGFVLASTPDVGDWPAEVIAADLYNDGKLELVCAASGDQALSILTNGGAGVFGLAEQLTVGSNPEGVVAADVNGDGYLDLISANYGYGGGSTLTILTNNGHGGFALAATPQVGSGPSIVLAADLNGNGAVDLVSVNMAGSLSVLMNDGEGNFELVTNLAVNSELYGGIAADLNGDGRIDLVAAGRDQSTVSVLLNTTVPAGPTITSPLQNFSLLTGTNGMLSVAANGQGALSYQWYFVATNHPGQAMAYAETAGGFVYGAVVTNGGFGYGNIPAVSFVGAGGSGASGYGTISNGMVTGIMVTNAGYGFTNLPAVVIDPPNGLLIGETNRTLIISNAGPGDLGSYHVVVSDQYGSTTSSVVTLTLLYPPSLIENPAGKVAEYLSSNILSVLAVGTAPLGYQWLLNGTNIVGATNSTYTIACLALTNAGVYTVMVSNPYGTVLSGSATVEMSPALTSPFAGAIGLWGQSVSLNVGAVGSGLLSYQWYFNGAAIAGATNGAYELNDLQLTNAGLYNVVVSSAYGSVTNTAYQVVVNPANISLGTCPMIYIAGTIGYSYTIQSTTNLADTNAWVTLTNLTIPYTPYIWADTSTDTSRGANPQKFYRLVAGP